MKTLSSHLGFQFAKILKILLYYKYSRPTFNNLYPKLPLCNTRGGTSSVTRR